jgi:hypothetical protein
MDLYDVGIVQHYSMWLSCKKKTHLQQKTNKYCTVMQFIMCVFFDSIKTINWKKISPRILKIRYAPPSEHKSHNCTPAVGSMGMKHRLKGQCHEIFDFRFSTWISSPKPLIIPLGLFHIFFKIRRGIRSKRCITRVADTMENEKNLQF